jgi:hypothetical protein
MQQVTTDDNAPPELGPLTRWRLQRRLRKAARLLRRRTITLDEYSVIAVDTLLRLRGEVSDQRPLVGQKLDVFRFPLDAWVLLTREDVEEPSESSVHEYGPYPKAVPRLHELFPEGSEEFDFTWPEGASALLDRALMRLSYLNRWMFSYEAHLEKNRQFFPLLSEQREKIALAIVSALIGGVIALYLSAIIVI